MLRRVVSLRPLRLRRPRRPLRLRRPRRGLRDAPLHDVRMNLVRRDAVARGHRLLHRLHGRRDVALRMIALRIRLALRLRRAPRVGRRGADRLHADDERGHAAHLLGKTRPERRRRVTPRLRMRIVVVVRGNGRRVRARRVGQHRARARTRPLATTPELFLVLPHLCVRGIRRIRLTVRRLGRAVGVDRLLVRLRRVAVRSVLALARFDAAHVGRLADGGLRDGLGIALRDLVLQIVDGTDLERGQRVVVDGKVGLHGKQGRDDGVVAELLDEGRRMQRHIRVDRARLRLVVELEVHDVAASTARRCLHHLAGHRDGAAVQRRRLADAVRGRHLELVVPEQPLGLDRRLALDDRFAAARRRRDGRRRRGLHRTDQRADRGGEPQRGRSKLREHSSVGHVVVARLDPGLPERRRGLAGHCRFRARLGGERWKI